MSWYQATVFVKTILPPSAYIRTSGHLPLSVILAPVDGGPTNMGSRSLHSQIKEGKNSPQLNDVEEVRAGRGPLLGVLESFGSQLIGVLINVGGALVH
jgi:hypothetical protein